MCICLYIQYTNINFYNIDFPMNQCTLHVYGFLSKQLKTFTRLVSLCIINGIVQF